MPIKRKLLVAIFMTSITALLLTCLVLLSYELSAYKRIMNQNLAMLAEVIAANSTSILVYDDQKGARETLSSLKAEPSIIAAGLFDSHGKLYATYPARLSIQAFPASLEADGVRMKGQYLVAFQPVQQGSTRLGTLYLKQDLSGLLNRIMVYSCVISLVLVGAAGVALLLSNFFQERIAQPILKLAETARRVSEEKDYSVRVSKYSNDELGLLTDAFNEMLQQIQLRDYALLEAQEKLKHYARELEARVAERTAKLTETIAELEAFSYTLTHDLRAPLRSMRGFAMALQEEYQSQLGSDGAEFLERISTSAKRMDLLIQDVLTLSTVSRAETKLEPVDAGKLLQGVLESYPEFQPPRSRVELVGALPWVLGSEALLTQCVSNLLTNAVKFVPDGVVSQVQIWAKENGGHVTLYFKDNGIGIPEGSREKIFGIFERLSRKYEGTGIGLAIVRKAVDRMGGSVGVESEVGKGSTFWLELQTAPKPEASELQSCG
ncbi:MAG TPA: ATP-binding protein, partial [Clostridia bacterium]|nr:ATP-binding protein [Clostridia bacterium]